MRILHLDSGREMRGGQWQVLRLMRGQRSLGHDAVLLGVPGSPLYEKLQQEKFPTRPLHLLSYPQLARGADLTHAHDAHSHTIATVFRRGVLIVSRRVIFPVGHSFLSRRKYKRADAYIAVSEAVRRQLRIAGVDITRTYVVPDGVPLVPMRSVAGDRILIPRTADTSKGMALAQQAVADRPCILSENLATDLDHARLMVYISYSEGLGSAILLAMARGVPVIASRTGGITEVIEHERTGLLVENSAGSISRAIERLMTDSRLAEQLAIAARRRVETEFSEEQMVRKTMSVYDQVLRA